MNTYEDTIYSFNWYPNELPKTGDVVIVRKLCIDEMGAWVELLEYGCRRGFIPSLCAGKRHKIGQNKIKMGKIALSIVSKIDYEKNNIDLKHYFVKDENVKNAEKRFYNYRKLLKLLYHVSLKYENIQYLDLLKQVVYPLHIKYGNAYQALIKSLEQPEIINKLSIPKDIQNYILGKVERMFNYSKFRILGIFEAKINNTEKVDQLHQALGSVYDMTFDDIPSNTEKQKETSKLNITVIKNPFYSISIDVYNAEQGISFINEVLKKIEIKIREIDGTFVLRKEPKMIKQEEYKELKIEIGRFTDGASNTENF